jgi:isopentenyldiphosphate isomerase
MEYLEIVNREGHVLGVAPRSQVHGDPTLMHRVVHVLVFDRQGRVLLQKRSMSKDVAPGRWDTSVGGHVDPGETLRQAFEREMQEELGIRAQAEFLYSYVHTNPLETELVHTGPTTRGRSTSTQTR